MGQRLHALLVNILPDGVLRLAQPGHRPYHADRRGGLADIGQDHVPAVQHGGRVAASPGHNGQQNGDAQSPQLPLDPVAAAALVHIGVVGAGIYIITGKIDVEIIEMGGVRRAFCFFLP